ncbi:MAG: IMP dehydrogenase [Paracoccaceae bacterium]
MVKIYSSYSRTFGEYLLLPNLTKRDSSAANVDLRAPIVRFKADPKQGTPSANLSAISVESPVTSALMQSVSGADLSIALAKNGGLSFIFCSQSVEAQANMVRQVKNHKAGFVVSDSNVSPDATLSDVIALTEKAGHSTIAVTDNGKPTGKFLGLVTSRDYSLGRTPVDQPVTEFMTSFEDVFCGEVGIDLVAANELIWQQKLKCLPIVDKNQNLHHIVFRKDSDAHNRNPFESLDDQKRLLVGAGLNTRDYEERVPALIAAGADVLCIDSSDGYSEWQVDTIQFVRKNFPDKFIGAGNVVDKEGFLYLAEAGADFVKVGIGGGSICITREQKGIGRGQASAVIEVAEARDEYFRETGIYVPICSDGGISQDYHITIALAMGADFVMMGRYFARMDEAPGAKVRINNQFAKEYWGEGSNRARNWERYDDGSKGADGTAPANLVFEEGVDSYVEYAGTLKENLFVSLAKIRSTICNCGAMSLREFRDCARLTLVSAVSIREGGAHDVTIRDIGSEQSNV